MTKINFEAMPLYTGIKRSGVREADVREGFADLIYTNLGGIRAHALAMKIYKAEGAEGYDDEELRTIMGVAERLCTPAFIDSLRDHIKQNNP